MTERTQFQAREDEIDLFQCWMIVYKRWKVIFVLVLIAVVCSILGTRYLPKNYRVNAMISLGRVDMNGRTKPLTTLADLNQMLTSGSFLKKLVCSLGLNEKEGPSLERSVVLISQENSENILLQYDTDKPSQGVKFLEGLVREIQNIYNGRADNYRHSFDAQISKLKEEIETLNYQRGKLLLQIKTLNSNIQDQMNITKINIDMLNNDKNGALEQIKGNQERIKALKEIRERMMSMIPPLENNTKEMLKEKLALTQLPNKDGSIPLLLLFNNLQQNMNSANLWYERIKQCDLDINDSQKMIEKLKTQIATSDNEIKNATLNRDIAIKTIQNSLQDVQLEIDKSIPVEIGKVNNDIQGLEIQRERIEGIEVIARPDYFDVPVNTKRTAIIAIATFSAFFAGVCFAFVSNRNSQNPITS